MMQTLKPKADPFLMAFGIYGAVGFQLALSVVGGLFLGRWLDQRWNVAPWMTLVGMLVGSVGGFYNLVRLLNWNQKRKDS
jgi:ATP synthase protein I